MRIIDYTQKFCLLENKVHTKKINLSLYSTLLQSRKKVSIFTSNKMNTLLIINIKIIISTKVLYFLKKKKYKIQRTWMKATDQMN